MKLLATDYDGTLKYSDKVTQEDICAIQEWKNKGNLFVMDTGRSMESILEEVKKYNLPVDYFITNNGGMVFDKDLNELYASFLDNAIALDIMYIAKEIGGVISYVVNDGFYRHRIVVNKELKDQRYPSLQPDMSEEELMNLGKYAQIVISMENQEYAKELANEINKHFSAYIIAYSNKYVVDIVPKGISKSAGLQYLCHFIHIDEKDVYTIGDADNDIPLMEFGYHGACMSLANENVKKHAKYVVKNISEIIKKAIHDE